MVAGDLEGVAAVGEAHRDDELEVVRVRARVRVVADVGASAAQGRVDLRIRVAVADVGGFARSLDDVVGPDQGRLGHPRPLRDRGEQHADPAVGGEGVGRAELRVGEALRVGAVVAGVRGDEPALELVADHHVAGGPEQHEGRGDSEAQADTEAEGRAAGEARAHAAARPLGPAVGREIGDVRRHPRCHRRRGRCF